MGELSKQDELCVVLLIYLLLIHHLHNVLIPFNGKMSINKPGTH